MQTTIAALGAGLAALTLATVAPPALAGGYWDGGNPAVYGAGWCPPPPPPPCSCPPRDQQGPPPYAQAPPPSYDYGDQGPPPADDEGFAPSAFFEGDEGVGAPGYDDQGYYGGGPVVGVNVGFGFGGRERRSFNERQRFFEGQRFNERQRFQVQQQQRVFERQHVMVQQRVMQQRFPQQRMMRQPMMQPRQMRYGSGRGRW